MNFNQKLDELLLDWHEQREQGSNPTPEEICRDCPELLPAFREGVRALASMEAFLAPPTLHWQQVPGGDTTLDSQPPRLAAAPLQLGDYVLISEIARGGMGVVFKARQAKLDRVVALKMILASEFASEGAIRRFITEAQAAANLDHPYIVPIYEVGECEGRHYYSMGYVEGESLAKRVSRGALSGRDAADMVRKIALAIAYAHERGVIHRDLKPQNVLLDAAGEPRVTDFGLAKRVETDSELTATGQILGTPGYMPPEQARGELSTVGPLSDVYGLGAVLYCLLTGRPPFQAASVMETLDQVLHHPAVSPRQRNASVARDLDTICLKCLDKEPSQRYPSARALADDLQRFLDGRPIVARPISRAARTWRWCRRNPAIALSASLAVVLTLTAAALSLSARRETSLASELQIKESEAQRALKAKSAAETQAQGNQSQRVAALVDAVLAAPAEGIPFAIERLEPLTAYATPLLEERFADATLSDTHRLHAAFALARFSITHRDFLIQSIEWAEAGECSNIVSALRATPDALSAIHAKHDTVTDPATRFRFVIVLLHLGDSRLAEDMLEFRPDPVQRTTFIHNFNNWYGDVQAIVNWLRHERGSAFRSGLVLALSSLPVNSLAPNEIKALETVLSDLFRTAPDGATHSAVDYALRRWHIQLPRLTEQDSTPNYGTSQDDTQWFVNSEGLTMIKIPGGSLKPTKYERETERALPSFFLSDREVSIDQFKRFDSHYPTSEKLQADAVLGETSGLHPADFVNWYDAVVYCNWLSQKEGLSPCYTRTSKTGIDRPVLSLKSTKVEQLQDPGWQLVDGADGYRLPTECEWRYAYRARTQTDFCYGSDDRLLSQYEVYDTSRPAMCATRLPNPFGLFDMAGNVTEWCNDHNSGNHRTLGFQSSSHVTDLHFARKDRAFPSALRGFAHGFRVARSIPPNPVTARTISVQSDWIWDFVWLGNARQAHWTFEADVHSDERGARVAECLAAGLSIRSAIGYRSADGSLRSAEVWMQGQPQTQALLNLTPAEMQEVFKPSNRWLPQTAVPARIDMVFDGTRHRYGLILADTGGSSVWQVRSLRTAYEFRAKCDEYVAAGMRPVQIIIDKQSNGEMYRGLWHKDGVAYRYDEGLTVAQFQAALKAQEPGWRPGSVDAYNEAGERRYVVVWINDASETKWTASIAIPSVNIPEEVERHRQAGYYPAVIHADPTRVSGKPAASQRERSAANPDGEVSRGKTGAGK